MMPKRMMLSLSGRLCRKSSVVQSRGQAPPAPQYSTPTARTAIGQRLLRALIFKVHISELLFHDASRDAAMTRRE
jgi:hypothetical protein